MKDAELVAALRQLKVNTKSLACLGCGYEHNCSVHGCHLIGTAAYTISKHDAGLKIIRDMHKKASEGEKEILRYVISLFDPSYGNPAYPPRNTVMDQNKDLDNFTIDAFVGSLKAARPRKRVNDFERCTNAEELAKTLRCIDDNGYYMSGVTQDGTGVYTVFFRRPALD